MNAREIDFACLTLLSTPCPPMVAKSLAPAVHWHVTALEGEDDQCVISIMHGPPKGNYITYHACVNRPSCRNPIWPYNFGIFIKRIYTFDTFIFKKYGSQSVCASEWLAPRFARHTHVWFILRLSRYVRGLPLSTSAPRGGGGPKIGQFCGQTVLQKCGQGEGWGPKIRKFCGRT